jgi:hypothetical protein
MPLAIRDSQGAAGGLFDEIPLSTGGLFEMPYMTTAGISQTLFAAFFDSRFYRPGQPARVDFLRDENFRHTRDTLRVSIHSCDDNMWVDDFRFEKVSRVNFIARRSNRNNEYFIMRLWHFDDMGTEVEIVHDCLSLRFHIEGVLLSAKLSAASRESDVNRWETNLGWSIEGDRDGLQGRPAGAAAAAAETHARRQAMLTQEFYCMACASVKPLNEFLVPECGHAVLCRDCYLTFTQDKPHARCIYCKHGRMAESCHPGDFQDQKRLYVIDGTDEATLHTAGMMAIAGGAATAGGAARNPYTVADFKSPFCFPTPHGSVSV